MKEVERRPTCVNASIVRKNESSAWEAGVFLGGAWLAPLLSGFCSLIFGLFC
jgi:hypothetical protein